MDTTTKYKIAGSVLFFGGGAAIYYAFAYESKLLAFIGAFMWMAVGTMIDKVQK